ncbi:NADP-dependent oxidoreductase [Jidongwangia harbinensis]|uniref:NADP-dependent oxidoreductase n=1 Tax=Jidongwangia harbinensis TaxID=2878561 RepID=UPI001CDA0EE0|nr:NADP-dependent oxidoreductase [Jidongwangia harbinensis]MCA2217714.1 NADP-dependent oxidoreductase [Jidongwangia harbinensis]
MRAVVFDRFGPPGVLRIVERPDPEPGPGQVRVRVRAAGVQPFDVAVRRGRMDWITVTFPQGIGQEYSGVVDAVGPGVSGPVPGDEVLGSTMLNGHASAVVVAAENVVAKPPELDFPTAAALVAAAQTASGALAELRVTDGDVLLVHGAAGSVGTVAVQLARLTGATVIGTASPGNHAYLRQLGAIPVAYGDGLEAAVRATGRTPTVALDAAGGVAIPASVRLGVAPDRVGTIVDDKVAAEHGTRVVRAGRSPQRLADVVALAARGRVVLPVRAYPLAEVAAAHAAVETGHGRGKVVLIVEP